MQISETRLPAGGCWPIQREQLDQIQLIEQIVLVPQHQLVVRRRVLNRGAPAHQLRGNIGLRRGRAIAWPAVRQELRPDRK